MSAENVPLNPIPSSASTVRGSTPNKIIRLGGNTTPTSGSPLVINRPPSNPRSSSNPRSNSNSRSVRPTVVQKMNSLEESETHRPPQNRPPSRAPSRRKQRRWENMNLFGIQEVLPPQVIQEMLEQKDNEPYLNKYLFPLNVKDKKSAFEELLVNQELLTIFRHCEERFYLPSSSSRQKQQHNHKTTEEKCWSQIEKKIRTIIISSIQSNMKHFQFLLQMEKLLFAFIHEDLSASFSSSAVTTAVPQFHPMVVSYALQQNSNNTNHLRIELQESAFHRLLFHGICQFYGLKSQSFQLKNSKNKVIQVNKPRKLSVALEKELSFTRFLYMMILATDEQDQQQQQEEQGQLGSKAEVLPQQEQENQAQTTSSDPHHTRDDSKTDLEYIIVEMNDLHVQEPSVAVTTAKE